MKTNIVVIYSSHLSEDENIKFNKHISDTIGVKHHIFPYVNHNRYSLSEIYNHAIHNHMYEDCIFVMCHNDIIFKTKKWGLILLSKFNNTDYDIIGVAGSIYVPESGRWWEIPKHMRGIVEHTDGENVWVSEYSKEIKGKVTSVAVLDGVFISFNPDMIINEFDEDFKGFHFYDLGFTFPNYLDGNNIGVTTDIRILHKSIGKTNEQWEVNRQQFVEKYKDDLPVSSYYDITLIDDIFNTIIFKKKPKVSVIILTKNNLSLLRDNIMSWNNICKYDNYEIIIADTGSDKSVLDEYDNLLSNNIRLVKYNYYNFAKSNNDVVKNHVSDDSELILFCNDDIKLVNDALSRCIQIYNENDNVGTIGIRLHYGDLSIQHNGIDMWIDKEGKLRISHVDLRKYDDFKINVNYNSIGNTAGFMLINKKLFSSIGGFNENYIECFEDVELNLECRLRGLKNITVSDAVAIHYESVSRRKNINSNQNQLIDFDKLVNYIKNNKIL